MKTIKIIFYFCNINIIILVSTFYVIWPSNLKAQTQDGEPLIPQITFEERTKQENIRVFDLIRKKYADSLPKNNGGIYIECDGYMFYWINEKHLIDWLQSTGSDTDNGMPFRKKLPTWWFE